MNTEPNPLDALFITPEQEKRFLAARALNPGKPQCRYCQRLKTSNVNLHRGLKKAIRHARRLERGMKEIRGVLYWLGMIE